MVVPLRPQAPSPLRLDGRRNLAVLMARTLNKPFFAASLKKSLIQEDGVECAVDQAEQGKCVFGVFGIVCMNKT